MDIKDIVTLSDSKKYEVISKVNYNDNIYYYLVDINDISNILFLYEENGALLEIEDEELVKILLPKFFHEIKDII